MKIQSKTTTLGANWEKVFDINLFANGKDLDTGEAKCIFSCATKETAAEFKTQLIKLIEKFTLEDIEQD